MISTVSKSSFFKCKTNKKRYIEIYLTFALFQDKIYKISACWKVPKKKNIDEKLKWLSKHSYKIKIFNRI